MSSREHVVAVPFFILPLRIFQLVFGIILLGLYGYLISSYNDYEDYLDIPGYVIGGFGVGLWTAILTILLTAYYLVSTMLLQAAYHIFAVLALEGLAVIFWLVSWAIAARTCQLYNKSGNKEALKDTLKFYDLANGDTVVNVVDTVLALGLILWLTFLASFAFLLLSFQKHRQAGAPMTAGRTTTTTTTTAPDAEMGAVQQPMPATTTTAAPVYNQEPVLHQQQPVAPASPATTAPMH